MGAPHTPLDPSASSSPPPATSPQTINLIVPILAISGGHRVWCEGGSIRGLQSTARMSGGPSQPLRSSASLSGSRRPGEKRLDTEESLTRGPGMNPSPAPDSTAGAESNPHPMAVSTPPGSSGAEGGVPGGPGGSPRSSGGADGVPFGGQAPPCLYFPPYPGGRRPSHVGRHRPRPWNAQSARCGMPSRQSRWSAAPTLGFGAGGVYPVRCLCRPGWSATFPRFLRGRMSRKSRPCTSFFSRGLGSWRWTSLSPWWTPSGVSCPDPTSVGRPPPPRKVREEFRLRSTFDFLVHGARGEFSQVPPEARGQHFPSTSGWWPQVEVPCGFPARMPQVVTCFGFHLRGFTDGHRVCLPRHTLGVRSYPGLVLRCSPSGVPMAPLPDSGARDLHPEERVAHSGG